MGPSNGQSISLETEIRKLPPAHICKLSMLLNISDSWKKLMAIVPKNNSGEYRFDGDHFSLIEQASQQQKTRSCAEIFLDEWSTMGKRRPRLQDLLELVVKAELFRAADYIAINILNRKEGPKRPTAGPAAQIDVPIFLLENTTNEVERSSSFSGEVIVEKSVINDNVNLKQNRQEENSTLEKKAEYQIPLFLNDTNCSMFSEISEVVKSSKEEVDSSSIESSSPIEINELNSAVSDVDENYENLPRCLDEMNLSFFDSEGITASNKDDQSSGSTNGKKCVQNGVQFLQKKDNEDHVKEYSEEEYLSKKSEVSCQLPACLNDTDFSNLSEILDSTKSSNSLRVVSDECDGSKLQTSNVASVDVNLPACLNEMMSFVDSQELTDSNKVNELSQRTTDLENNEVV